MGVERAFVCTDTRPGVDFRIPLGRPAALPTSGDMELCALGRCAMLCDRNECFTLPPLMVRLVLRNRGSSSTTSSINVGACWELWFCAAAPVVVVLEAVVAAVELLCSAVDVFNILDVVPFEFLPLFRLAALLLLSRLRSSSTGLSTWCGI